MMVQRCASDLQKWRQPTCTGTPTADRTTHHQLAPHTICPVPLRFRFPTVSNTINQERADVVVVVVVFGGRHIIVVPV
jgi:hypothetical protein